jgi:autotransporter-associated beta strand protein
MEGAGPLVIGNGGTTGSITGNIVNNSTLFFYRSNAYTHSSVISGTGMVGTHLNNTGTITLNGNNTYTGSTRIRGGTLALGASGRIESSSEVNLDEHNRTFSILGNKTIKNLRSTYVNDTGGTVSLGGNTLTIGTTGQEDGRGFFTGKFTGTGSVVKTGTGLFSFLSNTSTASGTFTLSQGIMCMRAAKWAGNFIKNAGTTLEINDNATIGGNLTLQGGDITMNLTQSPSPKITVAGSVTASGDAGANKFNIVSGNIATPQALIAAASGGFSSTTPYAVNTTALLSTLSVNSAATELRVTVVKTDVTPPVPGAGLTNEGASFTWKRATDNITEQDNFVYSLYMSASNNIRTVAECAANGTVLRDKVATSAHRLGSITNYFDDGENGVIIFWRTGMLHLGNERYACMTNGLQPGTSRYFNVVVTDESGNKAAYQSIQWTVPKPDLLYGDVSIKGDAVFGQTLTAEVGTLFTAPAISDLGAVSYQWKRGSADITGATGKTYSLVQDDIGSEVSVVVTVFHSTDNITRKMDEVVKKAPQAAPAKPTLHSLTDSTIILNAIAGCQYRINSGAWQVSTTFEDLDPETTYSCEAYSPESATHAASLESEAAEFTTTNETGVDIKEITAESDIKVYPNPTKGQLMIENGEWRIISIEIFNIHGKKILNSQFSILNSIDISHLPAGIYVLRITTGSGVSVRKIIKE